MAHFAKLDSNNVVLKVIVISNEDVDANGGDYHADAEVFVKSKFGGHLWKQCSYNHNARKQFASAGYTYDADKNKFIRPKPYDSWSLNDEDAWEPSVGFHTNTDGKLADDTDVTVKDIRWDDEIIYIDDLDNYFDNDIVYSGQLIIYEEPVPIYELYKRNYK